MVECRREGEEEQVGRERYRRWSGGTVQPIMYSLSIQ